ncbi:phosphocarrier protein HPr [Anaerobacillus alkalilacustris]|uniref:Phosphocarrier protein HPr n=1 Tax=Anaerobacillus alkalilacustris TaxID=393763 RepID=A0A1S2LY85_9BACI|nr:phosphocarrier protein HPr [Anaerobacillus alkalilacustris]OIJ17472.1 phosphocarrier protein HPr [Anaerobacillus alkalilacustris]
MVQKRFLISADTGIHARPATLLVNKASHFNSELTLTFKERSVNLKSIMGVMSLGVGKGFEVTISAEGQDEGEALAAIEDVIKENLGEVIA